jgi:(1->4)-alpha-D-glucan 1-alpha-D-glucosylmutase
MTRSEAVPIVPRATYRFQFNRDFALRRAIELVPYLRDLGVSHVYASPLLKACPGSTHGYDVCDHSVINPEIGTEKELEELSSALRQHGMGFVLDIVPNHMGVCGRQNPWWWDVLKKGRSSRFASFFDIDWESPAGSSNVKVIVPSLGDMYEKVLERGELTAGYEEGQPVLRYFDNRFPIATETLAGGEGSIADQLARFDNDRRALDELIQKQNYRLAYWREANDTLNYRRFFEITSLASIRVEDQKVFDETHALFWKWQAAGWIDGLRVDHPDGLADPAQYMQRLRAAAPKSWIVVEKILGSDEQLPGDWPVAGTTGYDFMSDVTGLFIDPEGEKPITDFYAEFTGEPVDYRAMLREKKLLVLRELFGAEVNRLTQLLSAAAAESSETKNLTGQELREALMEVIADLPVYRTYARPDEGILGEATPGVVSETFNAARAHRKDLKSLDFLEQTMLLKVDNQKAREFLLRLQQLTGAAMAKGAEDTAFYCFNRLLALNLVGGDPGRFSFSPDRFHERCVNAQKRWPDSMLSTSTHDTKQSEEVRMRLCALSEIPTDWRAAVKRWSALNEKNRRNGFPDRNMEYFFYQTLVGAWPLTIERAIPVMEKAARQARQQTSWTNQNADYEKALCDFVTATLDDKNFIADVKAFTETLAGAGETNSLSQTLLKMTTPGVPDIYQGTELWNLSLHDPDNRRLVGYERRKTMLAELKVLTIEEAWRRRSEGLPKLWIIQKTLQLRARHPEWFDSSASYEPIRTRGEKADHVFAFARGAHVVSVVPRLLMKLAGNWKNTSLTLPDGEWTNEFTGEKTSGGEKSAASLLHQCPVALLSRETKP